MSAVLLLTITTLPHAQLYIDVIVSIGLNYYAGVDRISKIKKPPPSAGNSHRCIRIGFEVPAPASAIPN